MDARGDHGGPVAIIGIACRFPGARDPAEFHDLVVTGRRMFQPVQALPGRPLRAAVLDGWTVPEVTQSNWPSGGLAGVQPGLERPGSERPGLERTDLGPADLGPAGLGPADLEPADLGPVQKLATEITALALTDAGLLEAAGHSRTGVIIAGTAPGLGDFASSQLGFVARGSYPTAAQTSSLHAVAAAAAAVQTGELDLAIAGGAELGLDPVWLTLQARAGTLGTDQMRVYTAEPTGLLPGEGCGVVILVRSADARAAGVPVYAEIAGWSEVPAGPPDLAGSALEQTYRRAGIDPADIQYIEGQGTGTAAGDWAELAAFSQLRRDVRVTAALGAASASIGYSRAAAGIASLIKTAVAMAAGTIPPGPGGQGGARPHPLVASGDARLRMPERPESWPDDGSTGVAEAAVSRRPRLAAVHSLGTADPAVLAGHASLRDAEGIHLVLRREVEGDRWAGRRRRAAQASPQEAMAQEHGAAGKHTARRGTTVPLAGTELGQERDAGRTVQEPVAELGETRQKPVAGLGETRQERVAGLAVRERTGYPRVFVLRGGDPGTLAGQLDVIEASAVMLSDDGLEKLARQLAAGALEAGNGQAGTTQAGTAQAGNGRPSDGAAPLRVALTAAGPHQLARHAGEAAQLLRTSLPAAGVAGRPGVSVSVGACGAVAVLFPGRAESPAGQPALLAASLEALGTLDVFGVRPTTGVGYGLGEITGLAWAGCIPAAEAARLVAQCGQVLRACACGTAAMARVTADVDLACALAAPGHLHIAAFEGPRTHVLAGSTAGVRELTRRAAMLKVPVEVLDSASAMYSPGMARCAAPMRSVLAATSFAPPRRRLISTITGSLVTPEDDLASLLAAQVTRPVLFAQAMAQAAHAADLIVIAGPDGGLAIRAAECGGVPAVAIPGGRGVLASPDGRAAHGGGGGLGPGNGRGRAGQPGPGQMALAQAAAALFAAGAFTDLAPYLGQTRATASGGTLASSGETLASSGGTLASSGGTLASRTVPRMRPAEPLAPAAANHGSTGTADSASTAGIADESQAPAGAGYPVGTGTADGTGARSGARSAG